MRGLRLITCIDCKKEIEAPGGTKRCGACEIAERNRKKREKYQKMREMR